ncbi:hypothetical protein HL653_11825 [Sphingomonas sp. AP4-R1]|uniref:hypothetical protein n=1 Tax=Sphingomonas sp. AP4-R1 TaxID=2735134 RepID=UPI0014939528|nr:hypothetical protein [Sphingomonas sp. AP4-R1]QJU58369.1 hypothetical protein HL653_11825 [Sphingomonas sp. AP4-R1]
MAIDEVAFEIEVVVHVDVGRGELLQARHSPEPKHGALASSEGKAAVLDPVVRVVATPRRQLGHPTQEQQGRGASQPAEGPIARIRPPFEPVVLKPSFALDFAVDRSEQTDATRW